MVLQDDITASAYNGYEHIVTSCLSRATYDYKENLFTGNICRDGSSRLEPQIWCFSIIF
jgi:hypothetical protein